MGGRRLGIVFGLAVGGCGPAVLDDAGGGETQDAARAQDGSSAPNDDGGMVPEPGTSSGPSGTTDGDPNSGGDDSDSVARACPDQLAESAHCLVVSRDGVSVLGVDTGSLCPVLVPDTSLRASSLAWMGDKLFGCNLDASPQGVLSRVNLTTGEVTASGLVCSAVTRYVDALLVTAWGSVGELLLYPSFDDVLKDAPSQSFRLGASVSRMTVAGDRLFAAWHSTDRVEVWHLPSEALAQELPLEGHNDWVQGLSVVGDRLFVLGSISGDQFIEFNATTGERVAERELVGLLLAEGLECRAGTM